jgi:endoglucanase
MHSQVLKGLVAMAKLRNSILASIIVMGIAPGLASAATGTFTADQYKKALWMTTRYFGAIRSGNVPNWAIQDSKYPTSFVKDSYKGNDVSGGWYDCGDHVMFGQTQFYAAYVLAKGYATWKSGFTDVYHGDFSDYKSSQDYSIAGGTENGMQDVLEELRNEADWLVKITFSPTDFVYQKGEGDPDHHWWVHAGRMSTMPNSEGGEKSGSRKILGASDATDGSMPGQCAAMLAVMARVDPDPALRATYLQHSKNAYAYSKTKDGTASAPGFYGANRSVLDARLNAATELWVTTGETSYKTEALAIANNSSFTFNSGWRLDYENDEPIAMMNAKYVLNVDLGTSNERNILKWLTDIWASAPTGVTTKNEGGFPLRGLSGYAFMTALYGAYTGDHSHDQFIFNQIDYMLGVNSSNQSYLVGWDESGKKSPTTPHIRGYYLNEDTLKNTPGAVASPAKMKYLGAMVGGSLTGTYTADITVLSMNEPCAELNAPVVASLGYLVAQVAPVDTSKFGVTSLRPLARTTFDFSWTTTGRSIFLSASSPLQEVTVTDLNGRVMAQATPSTSNYRWTASSPGIYLTRVRTASGWASSKVMVQ